MTAEASQTLTITEQEKILSCKGYNKDINLIKYSVDWNMPECWTGDSPGFVLGANSEFKGKLLLRYPGNSTISVSLELTRPRPRLMAGISSKLDFIAQVKCMAIYNTGGRKRKEEIEKVSVTVLDGETEAANVMSCWTHMMKTYAIRCEILLLTGSYITKKAKLENPQSQVLESLASLFRDGLFADVTFAIRGEKILVHKNIIAARSVVFKAMFLNDMQESKSNIVKITDASVGGFREFLHFIYTGQVTDLETHGEELLCLAEKYALQDLKDLCEESLMKSITVDNAARLIVLSDLQRATQLKLEAISFFFKHREAVRETEEWERARGEYSNIIAFLE